MTQRRYSNRRAATRKRMPYGTFSLLGASRLTSLDRNSEEVGNAGHYPSHQRNATPARTQRAYHPPQNELHVEVLRCGPQRVPRVQSERNTTSRQVQGP